MSEQVRLITIRSMAINPNVKQLHTLAQRQALMDGTLAVQFASGCELPRCRGDVNLDQSPLAETVFVLEPCGGVPAIIGVHAMKSQQAGLQ